jgi:hypothetical protein
MTTEKDIGQCLAHSHDEMYLVSHHMAGSGVDYFSCHHCGFIRVPELDQLKAEVEVLKLLRDILAVVKEGLGK